MRIGKNEEKGGVPCQEHGRNGDYKKACCVVRGVAEVWCSSQCYKLTF